jgi:hypothetical protein
MPRTSTGWATARGSACVEFDADPGSLRSQYNRRLQMGELFIVGDVDLAARDAVGYLNQ